MNLTEFKEKCKSDKVFITLVIVLVGVGSFGLGRLSKIKAERQGISIEASAAVVNAINGQNGASNANLRALDKPLVTNTDQGENIVEKPTNPPQVDSAGQVVASKNGTKYHFPWCSGGKTISEANKIYFNSIEEARDAGYTPAANCKGLK